jgi:hypothetical protein
MENSRIHSHIPARSIRPMALDAKDIENYQELKRLGISVRYVPRMIKSMGMDSNDVGINPSPLPGLTAPSISTPVQFLQHWLPGFVAMLTAPRKIDELVGITTAGNFEDEEIVQGYIEHLGSSVPYTDYGNIPLASFNTNFERRTIVRNELGFSVGHLEELRTSRIKLSTAAEKRNATTMALEIQRNRIGFYGFNNGANRTFGFLNDPNLPDYVTVAEGASGETEWVSKTYLEIVNDFITWLNGLQASSKGVIDAHKTKITIALPNAVSQFLSVQNELGTQSVGQWLKGEYPNVRVEFIPELDDANGGLTAVYVYAESINDGNSSDGGRVFEQFVPAKFITLGVDRDAKSYIEDFANASAGVFLKRPEAVSRFTGI